MKHVLDKREKQKRADHLHRLLHGEHLKSYKPLTDREVQLITLATRPHPYESVPSGIESSDIKSFAESCAFNIVTQQPLKCREVTLRNHENKMVAWRAAQIIIFGFLFYGITPLTGTEDLLMSRHVIFVLFHAFVAISAWCRYCDKWYTAHQKETALLNEVTGNAEIKLILLNKNFAEDMRRYYLSPKCEHKAELAEYLHWWHDRYSDNTPFDEWIQTTNLEKL